MESLSVCSTLSESVGRGTWVCVYVCVRVGARQRVDDSPVVDWLWSLSASVKILSDAWNNKELKVGIRFKSEVVIVRGDWLLRELGGYFLCVGRVLIVKCTNRLGRCAESEKDCSALLLLSSSSEWVKGVPRLISLSVWCRIERYQKIRSSRPRDWWLTADRGKSCRSYTNTLYITCL